MAEIISKTSIDKVHQEHRCFERNGFLRGFFSCSNYCPECGEYLLKDGTVTYLNCSACNQSLLLKTKYCPNCGVKFE